MNNLSLSSNNLPLPQLPKWLLPTFLLISFIGFFDALYLTFEHYRQGVVPCVGFKGCEQVLNSQYAVIWGVPLSLVGAIYYLVIFIAGIIFLDHKNRKALLMLGYLPIAGLAISIVLVFLQLFVLKAICLYCVVSAISSTVLFILGLNVLKYKQRHEHKQEN